MPIPETNLPDDAERLRAIADNVPALIAYIDAGERFRFVNQAYCTWFGFDPAAMIGRSITEVFGEDFVAKARQRIDKVLAGERVRFEGTVTVDGKDFYLESTYVPDRGEDGVVRGFYITVSDLSARQRFEQALQDLASLQDAILDNANFAIVTTDVHGVIRSCNSTTERWLGYRAEEIVGRETPALFHDPAELAFAMEEIERTHGRSIKTAPDWVLALIGDSERSHDEREWTFVRKDGSRFPVSLSVSVLRDKEGRPTGTLGVSRDITAEKAVAAAEQRARAEGEQARRVAEQTSRAKSQFLANMSHEVRSPLHGILGVTAMLLETPLSAAQRSLAETVHDSAQSLLSVVNGVLDFSRIEAGKLVLNPTDFTLAGVVRELVRLHAVQASEKGIALEWHIAPEVPESVRGDADRLRQVLHNLLGNAVKFSTHGTVRLRVEPAPPGRRHRTAVPGGDRWRLRFSVSDDGIGIAPEAQARIFEAFAQADDSMARRFGGTGLGLAIARELVELMGGEMGVESSAGAGATFWFTTVFSSAPVAPAPAAPQRPKEVPADITHRLRVLLVEDSEISRVVAEHQLCQLDCGVTVVCDGLAAISVADGGSFDLVLMDCQMPGTDGYTAATEIRRREAGTGRHACIVAVTANVLQGERERCLAAGMDDYLSKPFPPAQLRAVIRAAACLVREGEDAGNHIGDRQIAQFRTAPPIDGEPLLTRLVRIFRREAPESLAAIQAAAASCDTAPLEAAAHKLKGSAANFGARRLQGVCLAIEELCREDLARFSRLLLPELESELSLVLSFLEREVER